MRIEGTLTKWNDDRGFGFITTTQGGTEIFVHISAFPRGGPRPAVGERVTFEVETDNVGKKRAKNLWYPDRPPIAPPSRRAASYRRKERPGVLLGRVVPLLVMVGLGVYVEYSRRSVPLPTTAAQTAIRETSSPYLCDGRTLCSQMTSCAEASFFLRNCPDVQMDGNHDGVPCEQQWCKGAFAK